MTGAGKSIDSSTIGDFVSANGIARYRFLSPTQAQISPAYILDNLFPLIGMHLEQAPDALALADSGLRTVSALSQMAGVKPDKDQLADKRVGHDLEAERGQRLRVAGMAKDDLFHVVRIVALDRGRVRAGWQVLNYMEEQRLHTLVLKELPHSTGKSFIPM